MFDPLSDSFLTVFGPSEFAKNIEIQHITKEGITSTFASWDLPEDEDQPASEDLKILNVAFFPDTSTVVLVLSTGDIYQATNTDINPNYADANIEIVGSIEEGIAAAKWSPDEEVLALATNVGTFILLTRNFHPISETKILPEDLSISKHVSVGWGKKETQFQGRGAKAAQRDPTMPSQVDTGILDSTDNREVQISWRGDGEVVAVNVIDKEPVERRTVRVYTREGTLDSVSEPVDRLSNVVSWRPSGNLIAAVQRKYNESPDLVFFERNGLRRGEFSLRVEPENQVLGLDWNVDSDTLAVLLSDRVQLWTTKNYHWYLKSEVFPPKPSAASPIFMAWHPEKPHTLVINYDDGSVEIQDYIWDIYRGATSGPTDIGLTMVVDGSNINLTPLSLANTPPPMSFRSLRISSTPRHVAVSRSNSFFAVLTASTLEIAKWDVSVASKGIRLVKDPNTVAIFDYVEIFEGLGWEIPHQVTFIGEDLVVLVADKSDNSGANMVLIKLNEAGDAFTIVQTFDVPEKVVLLKTLPNYQNAFFQGESGAVYSFLGGFKRYAEILKLPQRCEAVEVFFPAPEEDVSFAPIVFGLHSTGKLYVNEKQIANSATSLCMTDKYIIFTTAQHYLKFCHLQGDPSKIEVPEDNSVDDERCRAIERGSLLVSAMPSRTALTLQAPRGNLETIYPRVMVLTGVRKNITDLRYDLAFAECRVHRIDLNILYDYNPEQFFSKLDLFVKQLNTVEYLDLFLSGLREEDVSKTMYRSTIEELGVSSQDKKDEQTKTTGKVNKICDSVVEILTMEPEIQEKYFQSVLTAYACKVPPALEDALQLVGKGREENKKLTEFSIQHLCFLQDVNLLYDTALGIYDLPLTLLIAQQSQKDPKEYLPFLRGLHKLPLIRRKFEIDTYLKRYAKGLEHLSEIQDEGVFENEVLDYVSSHELYQKALAIYRYDSAKQNAILNIYASYLQGKMDYSQAGLIYEHLGDYREAVDLYDLAGDWQQALSISHEAYKDEEDVDEKVNDLANHLAETTLEARKYQDSATIYYEYLNNVREATKILCKGFLFNEAIRLVAKQPVASRVELIDDVINPGLLEGFGQITELVSDCKGQINSQISRLGVLRTKKEEDPMAFFGGGDEADTPDNVSIAPSETSTAPSFMTRYTGKTAGTAKTGASRRTAKNRRREERKRARGKKGSIYEEEYLINSMGRLIERLHDQQVDAVRLRDGLLRQAGHSSSGDNAKVFRSHAYQIQKIYTEVMDLLQQNVAYVFTMTERDRERFDDEGEMYLIPEIPVPTIKPFPKLEMLEF